MFNTTTNQWTSPLIVFALALVMLTCATYFSIKREGYASQQNLVLITSVIHTAQSRLSYGQRSVMTPAERFQQTLETIKSVKDKIPNPYIVLIEGSDITPDERDAFLDAGCDYVHRTSPSIQHIIDGPHKSVAEVNMLLDAPRFENMTFDTFSKISGRYVLTNNFSWDNAKNDAPLYACKDATYCYTRYYRFPYSAYPQYRAVLQEALQNQDFVEGRIDIETYNIFKSFSTKNRYILSTDEKGNQIPKLGVKGVMAPFGVSIEDMTV